MSELTNQVYALQGKIQSLKREIKTLDLRGKNSIGTIRSSLDLLNLNDDEYISDLNIEAAAVEFKEILETQRLQKEKIEKLSSLEKELNKIKFSLGE